MTPPPMNLDDAIDALATANAIPVEVMHWLLAHWSAAAPASRALLHAFTTGTDDSERTSRALFYLVHLLAERADTACFPTLCRLLHDPDRANLLFGEDATDATLPALLVSTFDGDPAPLYALIRNPAVAGTLRADLLLALAYLARANPATSGPLTDATLYAFLAPLPADLLPRAPDPVWFGWARAVAALGYAGLATLADPLFRNAWIDPALLSPAEFWADLTEARADPRAMSAPAWQDIGPLGNAIQALQWLTDEAPNPPPAPIRNPMRTIGRNDPCPCGSGKKHKKCCLVS